MKKEEAPRPMLPRVLVNTARNHALEVARGYKFAHIVSPDGHRAGINYERISIDKLEQEWKEHSTDVAVVRHFCDVMLDSFRSKSVRAERTLREIQSMTIDVKNASNPDLLDFFNKNAEAAGMKAVKRFADRETAQRRVTELLAKLSPSTAAPADADAPLKDEGEGVTTSNETSTTTEGDTVKTNTTKKQGKPGKTTKTAAQIAAGKMQAAQRANPTKAEGKKATKKKAAAPAAKKTAKSISAAVKESWGNKKVAAARAKKDKVKVGGEVYGSLMKAFQKLKLSLTGFTQFRKELKEKGRATRDGHTFTIYNDPANA